MIQHLYAHSGRTFMFVGEGTVFMRPVKALLFIAVAGLLTSLLPVSNASLGDEVPEISIHQSNIGLEAQDTLYLNGSSTVPLADVDWFLFDLFNSPSVSLASGKLSNVDAVSNGHWNWNLELNVTSFDCTCRIVIGDEIDLDHHNSRVIYLGSSNHVPFIHPIIPHHQNNERQYFLLSNQDLNLEIPVALPPHSLNESFVSMNVCSAPSGNCLEDMTHFRNFASTTSNGQLFVLFELESLELEDGFWLFNITVTDTLLHTSNTGHFSLLVDQTLPTVLLSTDAQPLEQSTSIEQEVSVLPEIEEDVEISFSAIVDDGYIGGENRLTWTLVEPDGTRRAVAEGEYVSDSIISIHPPFSGIWTVELLVRDTAGWLTVSNSQFTVTNIAPAVKVEIDSFVVAPDYTVSLGLDEEWELNSSMSADTSNDVQSLSYTWYVNGNTFLAGKPVLDSSMFSDPGIYDVRLVVEDDNGASSEIQFSLSIEDSTSSTLKQPSMAFLAATVLISVVLGGSLVLVLTRKTASVTTVPKWQKKSTESGLNAEDSEAL